MNLPYCTVITFERLCSAILLLLFNIEPIELNPDIQWGAPCFLILNT